MLDDTQHNDPSANTQTDIPAPDPALQKFQHLRRYIKSGKAPWRHVSSWKREDLCNRDLVTPADVGARNGVPFPLRAHRFTSTKNYLGSLRRRFLDDISDASISRLKETAPELSAADVLSLSQKIFFFCTVLVFVFCLWAKPLWTIIAVNAFVTLYFILAIAYRAILVFLGSRPAPKNPPELSLSDAELPVITILLPLYRDADALISLSRHIDALLYPADKKDIKLLLEEDDAETIAEAKRLGLDEHYDLIFIPVSEPRTKPKACNYGMHMARGDLIVIYDAEDQPEPDQLLKAANAFSLANPSVACFQAHLNYYNANENWLTRLFTLEYSLWFDWLLPALQHLEAPIPLGGTSNFFRTDTLIDVGGWDPFNVTEDADLGLRLSKLGYRVKILDSTTFEEANCRTGNWIRQRSRWMKGYLQTWFVHMRHPGQIIATTGWAGLLSVQLFIAGNVLSALINPILWLVFILWLVTASPEISAAFPEPLLSFNLFALTFGNLFFILLAIIAPLKRGWLGLSLFGLTAPIYWLLTSVAAYKALWQIFFRPHYWEKTDHVISEMALKNRQEAIRAFAKN